jgi:MSHA biogenesis protein MshQ
MVSPGNVSLGGAFASGIGSLKLTKPTPAPTQKGSVSVTVDLTAESKTYLQTGAGFSSNPTSSATFGIYKSGPVIYMREMY